LTYGHLQVLPTTPPSAHAHSTHEFHEFGPTRFRQIVGWDAKDHLKRTSSIGSCEETVCDQLRANHLPFNLNDSPSHADALPRCLEPCIPK
jgi:hypothetical protein